MANLFDSTNYATTEPKTLRVGEYWAWKRSDLDADYPIASYGLTYSAVLEGEPLTKINLTASESGNDYIIEVTTATTTNYKAGIYHWTAFITQTSSGERIAVDSGTWNILENATATEIDPRSHVKIVLDALEALLQGKATKDQKSYTIGDRSLEHMAPAELLTWYEKYKYYYAQEINAENIANGLGASNTIRVRL